MQINTQLFIDGHWRNAADGKTLPIENPATQAVIGQLACATRSDLDEALGAAARGFSLWRITSVYERSQTLRRAGSLLRDRAGDIAATMTQEQGKPLAEARAEVLSSADVLDWFSEEARRTYGRIIPARSVGVTQLAYKEPVGPVAAFTPWNFPVSQAVRKLGAALAAGCSIILKGPEDTPASCAALIQVLHDAGVPAGVVQFVTGNPAEISEHLIASPIIRKITFTGSTQVGKQLAAMAGQHMKRATMELGGHAPVLVFDDADIPAAAKLMAGFKFRNAGQVCISPTRFLIQSSVYDAFVSAFTEIARKVRVGDGMDKNHNMGPLAHERRVNAVAGLVDDARALGANVVLGGERMEGKGYFYAPTVLRDIPANAQILHSEPFGPLAAMLRFETLDEAFTEANRLPYGLAGYAFTKSLKTATAVAAEVECGMLSINHMGLALPEVPFGGMKDSGYGSEGGSEAIESYLNTKFVSQIGV